MTGPDASPPRDRDPSGRPRNARQRDELGRPLPRGVDGIAPLPDDLGLGPDETLAEAQRLIDAGMPFRAHEVLEAQWKAAPAAERALWQGLAQLLVGLTHARRGNAVGASTLLTRGAGRVAGYVPTDAAAPPHGIDVSGLLGWVERCSAQIAAGTPDLITDPVLRAG